MLNQVLPNRLHEHARPELVSGPVVGTIESYVIPNLFRDLLWRCINHDLNSLSKDAEQNNK